MSTTGTIVAGLIEVQGLLIAWAIYPRIFGRTSQRG